MNEIDVLCDICNKPIPDIVLRKDDDDWYTEVYHKKCFICNHQYTNSETWKCEKCHTIICKDCVDTHNCEVK